jgi:long-chain acyl-CoA synthetase
VRPGLTTMPEQTFLRYLEYHRRHAAETAYVHRRGYRTERWTYSRTLSAAYRLARELEARGVKEGERVLIWGDNCAEWVAAFLGTVLRGAVAVPMDRVSAPDFARRVADQVSARLCFCSRELAPVFTPSPVIVLEDLERAVAGRDSRQYVPPTVGVDEPLQLIFTSGTTADPKGVIITHRNVVANLRPFEDEIAKYLKYERFVHPLRFLNLLPLSHVFGQFLSLYIPPLLGGTVHFQESLNPTEIIDTVRRERVSVLVAVPRILESLRDKLERDLESAGRLQDFRERFRSTQGKHFAQRWWRFRDIHNRFGWKFWAFISGGATLDRETEEFWGRLSFVVIQGYGLTETTSLISVNHPFRLGKGSIGKVLPGREIRLDESGEILVRGDGIAAGYFQGKDLKPVAGASGWFHTGDVGELDRDGNLYFKGRKKNVIVTAAGMNVFPEDLEGALRRQPGVRDCIVFGLDREGNAEPCAVLLLEAGAAVPESIVKAANAGLAEYQHVRQWLVWPEEDFPRTSTQKPRTNVIIDVVQARLAGRDDAAPPAGSLEDLVSQITGRPMPQGGARATLGADLGLSSMDRVELLGAIEDRYQVDLNESRFSSATTLADIERMLHEPEQQRTNYSYPRWPRNPLARLLRIGVYYASSWPAMMLMARPLVRGRRNLAEVRGPVLVVSNHITQVDIGYVMAALPPRFRHRLSVAMRAELLESMRRPAASLPWHLRLVERVSYGLVLALFNVFPLPQHSGFRRSFAHAGECVDEGYSVLVFPEGSRSADGSIAPFRAGVGMLALRLRMPVVPVRIDGLWELKQAGRKLARPGSVRVTVGAPILFGPESDPTDIAHHLEAAVRRMEWKA